ncbi:hypothetical protein L1887_27615 [Cichorium endivia]|nr:hypothetical protein L1887_27615 [Cichorium endivia]
MWKQSYKQKKLDDIIFEDLKQQMDRDSLEIFSDIASQCLQKSRERRPKMLYVLEKLETAFLFQERFEDLEHAMDYEEELKFPQHAWIFGSCNMGASITVGDANSVLLAATREDVQQVVCMICNMEQPVNQICGNCGVKMGEYFCGICKLFDDDTSKQQFHCNDCGICRLHGRQNYYHCHKCGCCRANEKRGSHTCVENLLKHECPGCHEYLFNSMALFYSRCSRVPTIFLPTPRFPQLLKKRIPVLTSPVTCMLSLPNQNPASGTITFIFYKVTIITISIFSIRAASYCFRATITNNSTTAPFVFFSRNAEEIVDIECWKLVMEQGYSDPTKIPPALEAIKGQKHIFQFHFNSSCKKGSVEFVFDTLVDDPKTHTGYLLAMWDVGGMKGFELELKKKGRSGSGARLMMNRALPAMAPMAPSELESQSSPQPHRQNEPEFVKSPLTGDSAISVDGNATTIAAYARITVEDSKKLLAPEFYPSWVVFSQRQKLSLNWLNADLSKFWPYVDEANLEPTLEQYRPMVLSSLSFSKFTLGTVASQFTGVSIIDDGSEGITMEMEMNWDGNRSIILDIKTRLGVGLPVQRLENNWDCTVNAWSMGEATKDLHLASTPAYDEGKKYVLEKSCIARHPTSST